MTTRDWRDNDIGAIGGNLSQIGNALPGNMQFITGSSARPQHMPPEDCSMPKTLRPLAGALIAALAALPLAAHAQGDLGGTGPEPDSLWLVGLALGVMIWFGWRSRR
jgi:hypothetical protein